MGMFDYVACKYPLPKGYEHLQNHSDFQTKDFEYPYLNHYEIKTDGTLWYMGYGGSKDLEYHGDLHFYTLTNPGKPSETWYDFHARFTEGRLVKLTASNEALRANK